MAAETGLIRSSKTEKSKSTRMVFQSSFEQFNDGMNIFLGKLEAGNLILEPIQPDI